MACPKCSFNVDPADTFCRQCGTQLAQPLAAQQALLAVVPEITKAKEASIEELKKEAKFIQSDVVSSVNEKTDKYMDQYYKRLTTMSAVVLGLLGFLGYSTWSSFDNAVKKSEGDIDKTSKAVQATIAKEQELLDSTFKSVRQKMAAIDSSMVKINEIDAMYARAKHTASNIDAGFRQMDTRLSETGDALKSVRTLQNSYERIKNSEIDLVIQTNARTSPSDTTRFRKLLKTLERQGYLLRKGNLLTGIGVDKTEVIYYSPESRDNVLSIVKCMRDSAHYTTQPHFIEASNASANLILIKLKVDD